MKCDKCGREIDFGAVFCGNCGNKLSAIANTGEGTAEGGLKKICPACKIEWDNDVDFCGECGTATVLKADTTSAEAVDSDKKPEVKICAQCGSMAGESDVFCGNCGFSFSTEIASAHSLKSTMKEVAVNTDPSKIENDKRGNSFFSKAGEL